MNKVLYILRGLPGSGKSEFAAEIVAQSDRGVMIAADDFMGDTFDASRLGEVHSRCREFVQMSMIAKMSPIVVHNTNTRHREFKVYEEMACHAGYKVRHIIVENRHGSKSVHNVPDSKVREMNDRFEVQLMGRDDLTVGKMLDRLIEVGQSPKWHPEGNVYNHTMIVIGRLIARGMLEATDNAGLFRYQAVLYAALFHDFGKLDTTKIKYDRAEPRIVAYGHERVSVEYVHRFKHLIPDDLFEDVVWLVANHMRVKKIDEMREHKRAALTEHPAFHLLTDLASADDMSGYDSWSPDILQMWFMYANEFVETVTK